MSVPSAPGRATLRIAAVQCRSRAADIAGAVIDHEALIQEAADGGARVVLFPELSLTGYEPELIDMHRLRVSPQDPVLALLSTACRTRGIHALTGAPVAHENGLPEIGILHIDPSGNVRAVYAKQFLTVGETGIFAAGRRDAVLKVDGWRLALSQCLDAAVEGHQSAAVAGGADAYLVGALYLIGAEERLEAQMISAARKGMWVVLAQYCGGTGGGPACGGSGGWAPGGAELTRLGTLPGIAFVDLAD